MNISKTVSWISSSPLVQLADAASKLAIFVVAAVWVFEADERERQREDVRKDKIYRAFTILSQQTFLQVGGPIPGMALAELMEEGISLRGMELTGGTYTAVNLDGADFRNGDFYQLEFNGVSLVGADFSGAHFTDVSFKDVNLKDTKFHGAVFSSGSTFENVDGITSTSFIGSIVCLDTKLPDGIEMDEVDRSGSLVEIPENYETEGWWASIIVDCIPQAQ